MAGESHLNVLISYRFLVALMVMLCTFMQYAQKVDISFNIICMLNNSALDNGTNASSTDGPFLWDQNAKGLILSAFFWGYAVSQIPGGFLASKFGPKITMLTSMTINGVLLCLYGSLAPHGFALIVFLRVVLGLSAGMIFPSVTQLWSRWAPAADRSILIGFAVSGSHLGSVFTFLVGGPLCENGIGFGEKWASLFYLNAILTFTWCIMWTILFRTDPQKHPFVSEKEKQYILRNTIPRRPISLKKVPWLRILKSRAFIAHDIYHTLVNWGFYIMLTNTPTYMNKVLHFDIAKSGFISCIPFLLIWLTTTSSGLIADVIINRQLMTRTSVRKLANCIGSFGPGIFTIAIGFVDDKTTAIVLYSISAALFGVTFGAGFMCVCNDIGGSISGIVFGMANTIGSIPGIIAPYVTTAMTPNNTQAQWKNVFIVAGVIYFIAGIEFLIFGTALPQSYMNEDELRDPSSKNDLSANKKLEEAERATAFAKSKLMKQAAGNGVIAIDGLTDIEDIEIHEINTDMLDHEEDHSEKFDLSTEPII